MSSIAYDKRVIRFMVELYCRKHLKLATLSDEWEALISYAQQRLDHCRYGASKPACKACPTHCYRKDMAEKMREVMRWVGPRMIFLMPKATLRHVWQLLWRFN